MLIDGYFQAMPYAPRPPLPDAALSLPAADLEHSDRVHASWLRHFRTLPSGARILDIAMGIGPVALIARQVSREEQRDFELHSLDRAATLSAAPLVLDGIAFHACRYDETTPFADGYFDAVGGQWLAPEEGGCLGELRRVLKSGGHARFMFHAADGAAHRLCQVRLQAIGALLDEFQLIAHARHMFEVAFTQETALRRDLLRAAMLALDSQQRYIDAAAGFRAWSRGIPNAQAGEQVLQHITRCWERRGDMTLAQANAQLDRLEERLRAAEARMRAVCALALDEAEAQRIGGLFKTSGFASVRVRPLEEAGLLLGWDLQAA